MLLVSAPVVISFAILMLLLRQKGVNLSDAPSKSILPFRKYNNQNSRDGNELLLDMSVEAIYIILLSNDKVYGNGIILQWSNRNAKVVVINSIVFQQVEWCAAPNDFL